MTVKKDLLAEIDAKAKKIKQQKEKAKTKGDVERFVFDFFQEAEDMNRVRGTSAADVHEDVNDSFASHVLTAHAAAFLEKQIQLKFDKDARVQVNFTEKNQVSGVLITWSKSYQVANKCDDTFYIGVEQMLFN